MRVLFNISGGIGSGLLLKFKYFKFFNFVISELKIEIDFQRELVFLILIVKQCSLVIILFDFHQDANKLKFASFPISSGKVIMELLIAPSDCKLESCPISFEKL